MVQYTQERKRQYALPPRYVVRSNRSTYIYNSTRENPPTKHIFIPGATHFADSMYIGNCRQEKVWHALTYSLAPLKDASP